MGSPPERGPSSPIQDNTSVTPSPAVGWTALIPVKSSRRGKSRIQLEPGLRRELALAMAMDTAAAAAATAPLLAVLVVVEDEADATALTQIAGITARLTTARGLNPSILDAARELAGPVAVLPADLPSLRPEELVQALDFAGRHRLTVVADRQGSGTTLLAARSARELRPRYGPGSFAAHLAAGAVPAPVPASSGLRRDVDVLDDLFADTGFDIARNAVIGPRSRLVAARIADLVGVAVDLSRRAGGTVEL